MANKVKIYKNPKNNTCIVQAMSVHKGDSYLFIPSPFGSESMEFDTIEEAISQIETSGYEYCIVETEAKTTAAKPKENKIDYGKIVEVLLKNLGHENLEIRNSTINSLSKFGIEVADNLNKILQTEQNWLVLQSTIRCIEKIISHNKNATSLFLPYLIQVSESENTMVKSAALKAIEKICDFKDDSN